MSEHDSEDGGAGRKGFVRDVMGRLAPPESTDTPERDGPVRTDGMQGTDAEGLQDAIRFFGSDSAEFRNRLDRMLGDFETLRRRYDQARIQHRDAERQNEKLVGMLQEAKQQMELLKEEVDKLCAPPNGYGLFLRSNKDETVEILVDGRPMRVNLHPDLDPVHLEEGQMVLLNEAFNVVESAGYTQRGEVVTVVDFVDENRVLVTGHTDDERLVTIAEPLRSGKDERWRSADGGSAHSICFREDAEIFSGRGHARANSGHHLLGHRWAWRPDRDSARLCGTALSPPGSFQ